MRSVRFDNVYINNIFSFIIHFLMTVDITISMCSLLLLVLVYKLSELQYLRLNVFCL